MVYMIQMINIINKSWRFFMERRTWKEEIYDAFIALGGDAQ